MFFMKPLSSLRPYTLCAAATSAQGIGRASRSRFVDAAPLECFPASNQPRMDDTVATPAEPLIRNISDTALWVAVYRARESERSDAAFRDPFARKLAGERGEQIAKSHSFMEKTSWSIVARTHLIDRFIEQEVAAGADTVLNLAAGLDTRPYRLNLPSSLRWVEVDLPDLLTYKDQVLGGEKPVCRLERVAFDLSDAAARRSLFSR